MILCKLHRNCNLHFSFLYFCSEAAIAKQRDAAKLLALAIIAAQEAQSIQCRVTETRRERILVQSKPADENARSASTDVGGFTANKRTHFDFYGSKHRLQ